MTGITRPKHITNNQIVDAINAVGAYSITAVAQKLGARHSDVIYQFDEIPVLRKYYYSQHNLVVGQVEKEKRERVEYILRNARKNCPYNELYKPIGMTYGEFFDCVHSRKNLEGLFDRLYDGSRKMGKETIENIKNQIDRFPKGTPVRDIWGGAASYLANNRELKNKYVKKNGKIRIGRPKLRKQFKNS